LPKEITPKALRCGPLNCPALYEVTPAEMRCAFGPSCPALFEQEDGVLVIGKIVPVPGELKAKIGPDETLVWVPKGLLKEIEWA
jgi:hypothetical protein